MFERLSNLDPDFSFGAIAVGPEPLFLLLFALALDAVIGFALRRIVPLTHPERWIERMSSMESAGTEASAEAFRPALMNGRLEWTESASLEQSYQAALGAVDAMEFGLRRRGMNEMEARVLGERADGDAVIIRMFAAEDGQTQIALRVGAQGDEAASHQLFDEIQSRLAAQALASAEQSTD